jgi:20S proteasome subunit alpha 2
MEIEDAVHTAILTLKEGMEGQLTESMIEIGVAQFVLTTQNNGNVSSLPTFKSLSSAEIKDYLSNIA